MSQAIKTTKNLWQRFLSVTEHFEKQFIDLERALF